VNKKINWEQLGEKIKLLLPSLGIGAVVAFLVIKLFADLGNKYIEFKREFANQRRATATMKSKVNYFSSVDQARLAEMESILNKAVFKQDKSYYLVGVIQQIASEYGYMVDSFSAQVGEISKADAGKKVDTVDLGIKIALVGPRERYLELISRMEKMLPVLSVSNFKIKTAQDLALLEMEITAFFIPKIETMKINNLSLDDLALTQKEMDLIGTLESYKSFEAVMPEIGSRTEWKEYPSDNPFRVTQ